MSWFYVDDGFSDSKPVESMSDCIVKVPLRLAACGLWVLAGSWSAKEETDGLVPASKLRQLGGTPTVIRALVDPGPLRAPLCDPEKGPVFDPKTAQDWAEIRAEFRPSSDPIRFRNWPKWQRTHAENQARREVEAEKKRTQRAGRKIKGRNAITRENNETSPGDTTGDTLGDNETDQRSADDISANPVPTGLPRDSHAYARRPSPPLPYRRNSPTEEHSPNVGADERGLTQPITPSASRLVATLIPDTIPAAVRTALRLQASQLITADSVDPDIVAEALRRWLTRPGAGPGLLPSLAADIIREIATPNGAKPHKMRTLAELAAKTRAAEQTAGRKELTP